MMLFSMNECDALQKINFEGKLYQIIINLEDHLVVANTYEGTQHFYTLDFGFNVDKLAQKIANNLPTQIKKTFIGSHNHEVLEGCLRHIEQENLIFEKINTALICVYTRNHIALS